jgi:hypothetical protein
MPGQLIKYDVDTFRKMVDKYGHWGHWELDVEL